jgi:hypothetical protein
MIQVKDNYLWRGGDRIGKIEDNYIYDHTGKCLGYFRDNHVYDHEDRELAWIDGNKVKFPHDSNTLRLEDVQEKIIGGPYSDLARVAVKMFLGD